MNPDATSPPISATQAFDCSTDELWTLISAPGNLNDAHPFCKRNEPLVWDGETHRDRLVYLNGRNLRSGIPNLEIQAAHAYRLHTSHRRGGRSTVLRRLDHRSHLGGWFSTHDHRSPLPAGQPAKGDFLPALQLVDSSQTATLFAQRRRTDSLAWPPPVKPCHATVLVAIHGSREPAAEPKV